MNTKDIFQEFKLLADQIGIRIISDKGVFTGGYCVINEKRVIVLNKNKPLELRIHQLAIVFLKMNTTQFFIKPILRELIRKYNN